MNPKDLVGLTAYNDSMTILQERGLSNAEATEAILKLIAQAEVEVTEEMMSKLTPEKLETLRSLPDNTPATEIAEKLGLDGEEVDAIRAEKVAQLVSQMTSEIDEDDEEIETSPSDSPDSPQE